MKQHVYPYAVVSVSYHYKNLTTGKACWTSTKRTSLSFHRMWLVLALIQLKNCSFGVKQQSLTHSTNVQDTTYTINCFWIEVEYILMSPNSKCMLLHTSDTSNSNKLCLSRLWDYLKLNTLTKKIMHKE